MKLEVKDKFHCPRGVWHATCEVITLEDAKKPIPGKSSQVVRFRFAVDTDEGEMLAAISLGAIARAAMRLMRVLQRVPTALLIIIK